MIIFLYLYFTIATKRTSKTKTVNMLKHTKRQILDNQNNPVTTHASAVSNDKVPTEEVKTLSNTSSVDAQKMDQLEQNNPIDLSIRKQSNTLQHTNILTPMFNMLTRSFIFPISFGDRDLTNNDNESRSALNHDEWLKFDFIQNLEETSTIELHFNTNDIDEQLKILSKSSDGNFRIYIHKTTDSLRKKCLNVILSALCRHIPHINDKRLQVKPKYNRLIAQHPEFLPFLDYLCTQTSLSHPKLDDEEVNSLKNVSSILESITNGQPNNENEYTENCKNLIKAILLHILKQETIEQNYSAIETLNVNNFRKKYTNDEKRTMIYFIFFFINYQEYNTETIHIYFTDGMCTINTFDNYNFITTFINRFKMFLDRIDLDDIIKDNILKQVPNSLRKDKHRYIVYYKDNNIIEVGIRISDIVIRISNEFLAAFKQ